MVLKNVDGHHHRRALYFAEFRPLIIAASIRACVEMPAVNDGSNAVLLGELQIPCCVAGTHNSLLGQKDEQIGIGVPAAEIQQLNFTAAPMKGHTRRERRVGGRRNHFFLLHGMGRSGSLGFCCAKQREYLKIPSTAAV